MAPTEKALNKTSFDKAQKWILLYFKEIQKVDKFYKSKLRQLINEFNEIKKAFE